MSERNLRIVEQVVEGFNETGGPRLELFSPDVVFVNRGEIAGTQEFHGHDGLMRGFGEFGEAWQSIEAEIVEMLEGADTVVAVGRFRLKAHSGVELEVEETWAYWLADGLVRRVEQHGDEGSRARLSQVGLDQRQLLRPREALDPVLLAQRLLARADRLGPRQLHRQPAARVAAGGAGAVLAHAAADVGGPAAVERAVGAAQEVDVGAHVLGGSTLVIGFPRR